MNVIFLDLDGVLATEYKKQNLCEGHYFCELNPKAVNLLNQLTDKTNAIIVISSVWRIGDRWDALPSYLFSQGITGKIIDKTPRLFDKNNNLAQRGFEIKCWLDAHDKEVKNFVVLDDDSDLDDVKNNFVQVKGKKGLRLEDIEKAIKILEK